MKKLKQKIKTLGFDVEDLHERLTKIEAAKYRRKKRFQKLLPVVLVLCSVLCTAAYLYTIFSKL
jgi:hypothetical protein